MPGPKKVCWMWWCDARVCVVCQRQGEGVVGGWVAVRRVAGWVAWLWDACWV